MDTLSQMKAFLKKLNENDPKFKEELRQEMRNFKHKQQQLLLEEERDRKNKAMISLYNKTNNSLKHYKLPMNNSYSNKVPTITLNTKKEVVFNDYNMYNEVA